MIIDKYKNIRIDAREQKEYTRENKTLRKQKKKTLTQNTTLTNETLNKHKIFLLFFYNIKD